MRALDTAIASEEPKRRRTSTLDGARPQSSLKTFGGAQRPATPTPWSRPVLCGVVSFFFFFPKKNKFVGVPAGRATRTARHRECVYRLPFFKIRWCAHCVTNSLHTAKSPRVARRAAARRACLVTSVLALHPFVTPDARVVSNSELGPTPAPLLGARRRLEIAIFAWVRSKTA